MALVGTEHIRISNHNRVLIDQEYEPSLFTDSKDYTGFSFGIQNNSVFVFGGFLIDEGVSAFLVNPNDLLSKEAVLASNFPHLTTGSAINGSSFYLGLVTPSLSILENYPSPSGFPQFPPAYGWAKFSISDSGIASIEDHAVCYEGGGIVVGTTTCNIPEPQSGLLLLSCIIFTLFRSRK